MKNFLAIDTSGVIGVISPPVNDPIYTGDVNTGFAKIVETGIHFFYFAAGLVTLLYLLWGAYDWISSGGEKEKLQKAQNKIQSAAIGLVLTVVVLVVIATLEQIVLPGVFCIGLTCPIKIPTM